MWYSNFNSIKVQLEQYRGKPRKQPSVFQFHKGTIRTSDLKKHYSELAHFNSIKVQLERETTHAMMMNNPFQFHKGTIRTGGVKSSSVRSIISIP